MYTESPWPRPQYYCDTVHPRNVLRVPVGDRVQHGNRVSVSPSLRRGYRGRRPLASRIPAPGTVWTRQPHLDRAPSENSRAPFADIKSARMCFSQLREEPWRVQCPTGKCNLNSTSTATGPGLHVHDRASVHTYVDA